MDDENKPRAFSIEEGVAALRQSREDQAKPEEPQEEAEPEAEEVQQDQAEAEVDDESSAEDEQPDDEADTDEDEAEDEGDDDDLYEVGGEQFTLSQLREWKAGAMRMADYTRKTQEVAESRKSFEAERAQWDAERNAEIDQIAQQQAQLKEALATFAVDQDPEPQPEGLSWEEYTKRKTAWDKRQGQKNQAREMFRQLQQQQHTELLQREIRQLVRHFPTWQDPAVFEASAKELVGVAGQFGFSPEEMASIADHRIFRVLNELKTLQSESGKRKANEAAAVKKAAKAARQLTPGAKIDSKNQASKEVRQKRDQLRKTGSLADAVAVLQARRAQR